MNTDLTLINTNYNILNNINRSCDTLDSEFVNSLGSSISKNDKNHNQHINNRIESKVNSNILEEINTIPNLTNDDSMNINLNNHFIEIDQNDTLELMQDSSNQS